MNIFSIIHKPTLLIDEFKAKRNLKQLQNKIAIQNINFRPHFKTHQSAEIGEWFREEGIAKITVSSLDMANYFSNCDWDDIFVAFPVNILQIEEIVQLSKKIHLSLLFEEPATVGYVDDHLLEAINGWIKIDTGAHRCGLRPIQIQEILNLAGLIKNSQHISFKGIVTHAGHSYRFRTKDEISSVYHQSVNELIEIRKELIRHGFSDIQISVGDTPSATLVDDFGDVDELRPGNFLFYDVQQYQAGVCKLEDIAVVVACPVVALHPAESEVVIYGGAIHFSKDSHQWGDISNAYGLVTLPNEHGWDDKKVVGYLRSLSQEHGVAVFPNGIPAEVKPGTHLCVLPAHSCLTVQALGYYLNLDGERIETMLS